MLLALLGVVIVFYVGVALAVARLCSINTRWERLVDRIPGPTIAARVKSSLLPGGDDFTDEDTQPVRRF